MTQVYAETLPVVGANLAGVATPSSALTKLDALASSLQTKLGGLSASGGAAETVLLKVNEALVDAKFTGQATFAAGEGFALDFSGVSATADFSTTLDSSLGLPGLHLDLNPDGATAPTPVPVNGTMATKLGFAAGLDGASTDQFYLSSGEGAEVNLGLTVKAVGPKAGAPNTLLDAHLGFLPYDATLAANSTLLSADIGVELDGGMDGRLRTSETAGAFFSAGVVNGSAAPKLGMKVDFGLAAGAPGLNANLAVDWDLAGAVLNGTGDNGVGLGGAPTVSFDGVGVSAGSFLANTVGGFLNRVYGPLEPIFEIVDTLTAPLPAGLTSILSQLNLLSRGGTLADILFGPETGATLKQIDYIGDLAKTLVKAVNSNSGNIVDFGGFNFVNDSTGRDARSEDFSLGLVQPTVQTSGSGFDAASALKSYLGNIGDLGGNMLTFPLLQKEGEAYKLLLGQDADLVHFDPQLDPFVVDLPLKAQVLIFTVGVDLGATLELNLSGGYDTRGLRQFATNGFEDPTELLNGIFIDDNPGAEATLMARVVAQAGVGLAGIAEGGVQGGLRGTLLVDIDGTKTINNKLYFDTIAQNITNPLKLLNFSGKVEAFLGAYYDTFFDSDSIDFGSVTLFDFDTTAKTVAGTPEAVLASKQPDTSVLLHTGTNAGLRGAGTGPGGGASVDDNIGEVIRIKYSAAVGYTISSPENLPNAVGIEPASLGSNLILKGVKEFHGNGGNGDDVIRLADTVLKPLVWSGGPGADIATGGGANDTLSGDAGADLLVGGKGNDRLDGGPDNDSLVGEDGGDTLIGGAGNDRLNGGEGPDKLYGNTEADPGGVDTDVLLGGPGADQLFGSGELDGGPGADTMTGYGAAPIFYVDDNGDVCIVATPGGVGMVRSTASFYNMDETVKNLVLIPQTDPHTGVLLQLPSGAKGNDLDNTIDGNELGNFITGMGGNDTLNGYDGFDVIFGGSGNDTIDGGEGDDILSGGSGDDTIYGGLGNDQISGGTGYNILRGGPGDDVYRSIAGDWIDDHEGVNLVFSTGSVNMFDQGVDGVVLEGTGNFNVLGNDNPNNIVGNDGKNYLQGGGGDDRITGGPGDRLEGDAGDDTYTLTGKGVTVVEDDFDAEGPNGDTVIVFGQDYTLPKNVENLEIGGFDLVKIPAQELTETTVFKLPALTYQKRLVATGNSENNSILVKGDYGVDVYGLLGNDTLAGGGGDDLLVGGDGNDTVFGGEGSDTIYGRDVKDAPPSGSIGFQDNDHLFGDAGNDKIYGGRGDDELAGADGNDLLVGGPGVDSLKGGDGDDELQDEDGGGTIDAGAGRDLIILSGAGLNGGAVQITGDSQDILRSLRGDVDLLSGVTGLHYVELGTMVITNPNKTKSTVGPAYAYGTNGADYLIGNSLANTLRGRDGSDFLIGGAGDDVLEGGAAPAGEGDILYGGDGNDTLDGRDDGGPDTADLMGGGKGNDTYYLATALDKAYESKNGGTDRIFASFDFTLGANFEELTLTGFALNGTGNNKANVLTGNALANTLTGLDGDDKIYGLEGIDQLFGNEGRDTLVGGAGEDVLDGGGGDDFLEGGRDADTLHGGGGKDRLYAHSAAAFSSVFIPALDPNGPDDNAGSELYGDAGDDQLYGGGGIDLLNGGVGNDKMTGGAGNDVYFVDSKLDKVIERAGEGDSDRVYTSVSLTSLPANVEEGFLLGHDNIDLVTNGSLTVALVGNRGNNTLQGGSAGDFLTGGPGDDILIGQDGNDFLDGDLSESSAVGNDTLNGGRGDDTMRGGPGNDKYIVDSYGDVISEGGGGGYDTVFTSLTTYTLPDGFEALLPNPTKTAIKVAVNFTGNSADNTIVGFDGNDHLIGGGGQDLLSGFGGNDTYGVDDPGDLILEAAGGGQDTVESAAPAYTLPAQVENLLLIERPGVLSGRGNNLNNIITGNSLSNFLSGEDGNDRLIGGPGDDTMEGGFGNDVLINDSGADILRGGPGDDTYDISDALATIEDPTFVGTDLVISRIAAYTLPQGQYVENLTLAAVAGVNHGTGNFLRNHLIGNDNPNELRGEGESDTLEGRGGADTLIGTSLALLGHGEIDVLTGGKDADSFVLALASPAGGPTVLYDDGNAAQAGYGDFARIKDFSIADGDKLLLAAPTATRKYVVGNVTVGTGAAKVVGLGIFLDQDLDGVLDLPGASSSPDELIAVLEGYQNHPVDLDAISIHI